MDNLAFPNGTSTNYHSRNKQSVSSSYYESDLIATLAMHMVDSRNSANTPMVASKETNTIVVHPSSPNLFTVSDSSLQPSSVSPRLPSVPNNSPSYHPKKLDEEIEQSRFPFTLPSPVVLSPSGESSPIARPVAEVGKEKDFQLLDPSSLKRRNLRPVDAFLGVLSKSPSPTPPLLSAPPHLLHSLVSSPSRCSSVANSPTNSLSVYDGDSKNDDCYTFSTEPSDDRLPSIVSSLHPASFYTAQNSGINLQNNTDLAPYDKLSEQGSIDGSSLFSNQQSPPCSSELSTSGQSSAKQQSSTPPGKSYSSRRDDARPRQKRSPLNVHLEGNTASHKRHSDSGSCYAQHSRGSRDDGTLLKRLDAWGSTLLKEIRHFHKTAIYPHNNQISSDLCGTPLALVPQIQSDTHTQSSVDISNGSISTMNELPSHTTLGSNVQQLVDGNSNFDPLSNAPNRERELLLPAKWTSYNFDFARPYEKTSQLKCLASANVVGKLFDFNGDRIRCLQNEHDVRIYTSGNRVFYPGTGKQVLLLKGQMVDMLRALRTVHVMMFHDLVDVDMLPQNFDPSCLKLDVSIIIPSTTCSKLLSSMGSHIQWMQHQSNARIHVTCMRFEHSQIQERLATINGKQCDVERATELMALMIQDDPNADTYGFLNYPLYTKALGN